MIPDLFAGGMDTSHAISVVYGVHTVGLLRSTASKLYNFLVSGTHPVKDLEGLPNLVLRVLLVDLHGHHGEKLREVDGARAVLVHLVHHVLGENMGRMNQGM